MEINIYYNCNIGHMVLQIIIGVHKLYLLLKKQFDTSDTRFYSIFPLAEISHFFMEKLYKI